MGEHTSRDFSPPPPHDQETMSSLDEDFRPVAPAASPLPMRTDRRGDGSSGRRAGLWGLGRTDFRPFFELASKILPRSKTEEHRPTNASTSPASPRGQRACGAEDAVVGGGFSPDLSHKKCHLHFKSALTNSSLPSLPSVLTSFPPLSQHLKSLQARGQGGEAAAWVWSAGGDGELSECPKGGDCCRNFAIVAHPPFSPSFLPPLLSLRLKSLQARGQGGEAAVLGVIAGGRAAGKEYETVLVIVSGSRWEVSLFSFRFFVRRLQHC